MSERIKDGGPAFPRAAGPEPRVNAYHEYQDGMTLRAWLAGQALNGLIAAHSGPDCPLPKPLDMSQAAIVYADLLLELLESR